MHTNVVSLSDMTPPSSFLKVIDPPFQVLDHSEGLRNQYGSTITVDLTKIEFRIEEPIWFHEQSGGQYGSTIIDQYGSLISFLEGGTLFQLSQNMDKHGM